LKCKVKLFFLNYKRNFKKNAERKNSPRPSLQAKREAFCIWTAFCYSGFVIFLVNMFGGISHSATAPFEMTGVFFRKRMKRRILNHSLSWKDPLFAASFRYSIKCTVILSASEGSANQSYSPRPSLQAKREAFCIWTAFCYSGFVIYLVNMFGGISHSTTAPFEMTGVFFGRE
jgi:Na+/melibiose symporter-like transporter